MRNLAIVALLAFSGAIFAGEIDVAAIDANQDGVLQATEIAAIENADTKAAVVALDADVNGEVSAEELKALAK